MDYLDIKDTTYTPLKRLFKFLKTEKKVVYGIYFYALLNGLIALSLPLGIQAILNFILGGRMSTSWVLLVIMVMVGISFAGYLQINQLWLTEKLQQRIFTKAAFEFAFRIPRFKLDAIQEQYPPEIVNRFFDTINLQKGLAKLLIDISIASLQILFGLILLSFYHPFFIIFGIILLIILAFIFRVTSPGGMKTSLKESSAKYEVAYWLQEIARSIGTFKLAGHTELPFKKIDKLLDKYIENRINHFGILITQFKVMIGFKVLIVGSLLIAGSLLLINNEISIGQFVAAEIIIVLVVASVEKLILSLETIYDTLTAIEKMGHVTDIALEEEHHDHIDDIENQGGLKISVINLSYKYPKLVDPALNKVNLEIAAGEKVAIAGASGSGKSTLVKLIAGLYDTYDGRIQYNKISLTAINLEHLRTYLGDSFFVDDIFHGTIKENITLGRDGISEKRINEVVDIFELSDLIADFENGMDTMMNPRGKGLSRNAIKKFILARSVANKPKVLLLEEDILLINMQDKARIIDYLTKRPWTLVVISNDREILEKVDKIYYLEKGEVAFSGNFEEYKTYTEGQTS